MATIVLPGKKSVKLEGRPTLADLKVQGMVPQGCELVRKDPHTGGVLQLQDTDALGGDDLVFAVPRHIQGDVCHRA